jgi:branched-chain amino acid transport system substrate-binding protein
MTRFDDGSIVRRPAVAFSGALSYARSLAVRGGAMTRIGKPTLVLVAGISALMLVSAGAVRAHAARSPVLVGFLDEERGANPFPANGAAAHAARDYINSTLNGINGRDLKFDECLTDGSPEASIYCANQFVEAHVVAVLEGVDLGSDAALPILTAAHIPLIGHVAIGSAQTVSKDAFFFGAPIQSYVAAPLKLMAQRLHVKSVAFVVQDNPVTRTSQIPHGVAPAAKNLHLKLTNVLFSAENPDYTQTVTTALAAHPDALLISGNEPECTSLVADIRQVDYPGIVFVAGCTSFISADPKTAEGIYTVNDLWESSAAAGAPKADVADLRVFAAQMKRSAPQYAGDGNAQKMFSSVMDMATILRAIKEPISPAAVLQQLRSTRNTPSFMGQPIDCDGKQWPDQSSVCAGGMLVFRVHDGAQRAFSRGFVYPRDVVTP